MRDVHKVTKNPSISAKVPAAHPAFMHTEQCSTTCSLSLIVAAPWCSNCCSNLQEVLNFNLKSLLSVCSSQ